MAVDECAATRTCPTASSVPCREIASLPGLHPGTYCVRARGQNASIGWIPVCHGDPLGADPTFVTLAASQVVTGVDLDFSLVQPNESASWGAVKSTYR